MGDTSNDNASLQVMSGEQVQLTRANAVPYAVSKEIKSTIIGPNTIGGKPIKQTLDVLGFVVGAPTTGGSGSNAIYKNMYPITFPHDATAKTSGTHLGDYSGFHDLGGLYDGHSKELCSMRKAGLPISDLDTQSSTTVVDHAHKDWPDNIEDQLHLLNESPYADALFYHSTRLSFLLTGITIPDASEKASNHRGLVRCLIVRPRLPSCKMRWGGNNNEPTINMGYPAHWDTDLLYSKTKTLGGRLDDDILTRSSETTYTSADRTHMTPSFGFDRRATTEPDVDTSSTSLHYGHPKT